MAQTGENADELWNVLDADRNVTGRLHRRGDPMAAGEYHLVVHLCVFNSKNELLIQRRQPWKKGWGGFWDVSCAGSATAGDTSRQAVIREVREELGLTLDLTGERPLFSIAFEHGYDDFWFIEQDVEIGALTLQESEVADAKWANKAEVLRLAEAGAFIPYEFLDRLFEMKTWQKHHWRRLPEQERG
ncbi:MAG: NUDIX domain-containing protein [Oscillospiraceae bacterium]